MPFLPSFDRKDYRQLKEIPVTSTPIFEGHLYVRNDKKQWLWRLFRFDGSSFTCLSKRKVKGSTSNLLLTSPKRLTVMDPPEQAKYYQLPEWTVDVAHMTSISVLKRKNSNQPSKCFSIRSFDGTFILKAHKHKDLERWLFVLTKMWSFSQQQQQQHVVQDEDDVPLVQIKHPVLSQEKVQIIEAWRMSLAELMANDPTIKPPPIEPIPDDDNMSVFTDMTSVSNRHRTKRRVSTKRSLKRAMPHASQELPLQTKPQKLKKKRSDDVRNWMNTKKSMKKPPEMLHFFQDALSVYHDAMESRKEGEEHKLRYHPSVGCKRLVQVGSDDKRRASMPLSEIPCLLDPQWMSPLQLLALNPPRIEQDEEEISLADLQKSLRNIQLQTRRARSPSVSSLQDLQRLYPSPFYPIKGSAIDKQRPALHYPI
ncbi:uncharacterized protein B0P05DRAFT_566576 [Gilbertella persicaria]|uniref:uncharacterized protein n=1 Tax=Gilbertella persicaria TaxID=101096 RepID=UPI002220A2F7|nr:uncharacterized protein B0P05DRAFT_566576 [Gilbertella persicaria]KAI8047221.1 hypothetical protein B0P05DRAFT_566576 [Gilbertella persicaria]